MRPAPPRRAWPPFDGGHELRLCADNYYRSCFDSKFTRRIWTCKVFSIPHRNLPQNQIVFPVRSFLKNYHFMFSNGTEHAKTIPGRIVFLKGYDLARFWQFNGIFW